MNGVRISPFYTMPLQRECTLIDLEDAVKRNRAKEGMEGVFEVSSNGGYHGQRLYQKAIHQDFSSGVPGGAFNALSAVGRLLAALIQKSEFNTPDENPMRTSTSLHTS